MTGMRVYMCTCDCLHVEVRTACRSRLSPPTTWILEMVKLARQAPWSTEPSQQDLFGSELFLVVWNRSLLLSGSPGILEWERNTGPCGVCQGDLFLSAPSTPGRGTALHELPCPVTPQGPTAKYSLPVCSQCLNTWKWRFSVNMGQGQNYPNCSSL